MCSKAEALARANHPFSQSSLSSREEEAFLRPLHLDALHPMHLRELSQPFVVFEFDFTQPPKEGRHTSLQVAFTA